LNRKKIAILFELAMSSILYRSKKYDKAISYYDKVLERDPEFLEALINKGHALIHLKKYDEVREQETKNWVYDLIKSDGEFVFVAEVPGPEDKIAVRLVDGILYIRGTGGFSKEVSIEGAGNMQIFDFKYRNGVLTLRIK